MNSSQLISHKVQSSFSENLLRLIPLGVAFRKPRHFYDMIGILWKNRDNLLYAWKVITKGVCDGCALGVAGLKDWTVQGPHLCMTRLNLLRLNTVDCISDENLKDLSKLRKMTNQELRELGRIPYPLILRKGSSALERISWDEAYDRMVQKIKKTDTQRMAFFVTARGVTNEIYYVAQKVARFLGTNHIDNAARICHSPSTVAMKASIGLAASTCGYKDWYGTDLIVFFGSNPANDQPVSTKYLHEAKKLGTKVVIVNPYFEPGMKRYWVPSSLDSALLGTDIADYWFPVTQGGDIGFLYGVIKILIEEGGVNESFVSQNVDGFEMLKESVQRLSWQEIEKSSGLPQSSIREFADLIRKASNAVLIWSMGITQHTYGADAVHMILNLGLLRGYVGKDKNGLMPIRGHSSVQGGAEMGAYSTLLPGAKDLNEKNAQALSDLYGFSIPAKKGMTTTEMVDACEKGQLDFFYNVGGNLVQNLPEPDRVRKAIENVPVRIHQDIILNDQMLIPAQEEVIILPAKTRYEQDDGGTETSTERRVMFSPEIPRQVGEARAEWRILRDLAEKVYPDRGDQIGCRTGWDIRSEMARVVPFYDGVQHLKKTGDAFQYGGSHLCRDGKFSTPTGKALLFAVPLPPKREEEGLFMVSTRRGKQFNSLIYAENDPLNGAPRNGILMNEEDAQSLGLKHRDTIRLKSDQGMYEGTAWIVPIQKGNLQVHWPEGNVLIAKGAVDRGGVPDYNAWVRIEKVTSCNL